MNWTTLVSPEAVAETLGDPSLRLVDARFVLAGADHGIARHEEPR